MGIEIQKEWVCTHDDRTRPSHLELDGERRDLDEEFSNGLQYPGDPNGDPSEVYNCRCTLVAYLPDIGQEDRGSSEDVSAEEYEKWEEQKAEKQKTETGIVSTTEAERVSNVVSTNAEKRGIERVAVYKYKTLPTEDQIFSSLAILDRNSSGGSCQSLTLAAVGQKYGWRVTDNRGGESRTYFSKPTTLFNIAHLDGVKAKVDFSTTPLETTWNMIKEMTKGKENLNKWIIVSTGRHTAIVKRTGSSTYKYLELQIGNSKNVGWNSLTKTSKTDRLNTRFHVPKTSSYGEELIVIDAESLGNCKAFPDILEFIQSIKDKEKAGY